MTEKRIGLDDLDRLGIDEHQNLYWDGKPLVTREQITFANWINVAAILAALAAVVSAAVEVLRFLGYGQIG